MNLAQSLRILPPAEENSSGVAFVGAGGKTSALFQLARELEPPVIITATTHLGRWQIPLADEHIIVSDLENPKAFQPRGVTLFTGEFEGERTKGLDNKAISWLREVSKYYQLPLLIEADGARQKPLKAPAGHEPVIPEFVQLVVQVAGLSALGKPLDDEYVHRTEIFARLSGLNPGENINAEALVRVLVHPQGGLKNIPPHARRAVLLNQADTADLQSQAKGIANRLLSVYQAVIIASLKDRKVHAVREPIAGIILAAGKSQRFGEPKQLLDWRGQPFVRAVAQTAVKAGLSPVIVVTGAHAERVENAVQDLPVQVIHNEEWESGQASSIRAGLSPLPSSLPKSSIIGEGAPKRRVGVGGAIFLLADQPQLSPTILHALMDEHATTLAPIIAPMVLDQRANPVLFDQVTFHDLMQLKGDVGGRGIFSKYRVTYLPWHDDALLLDVDTPEHYRRLKDLLE